MKGNENIIIAECDYTANEIPSVRLQGYPTIFFYPNGKKRSPLKFEGDNSQEGIEKYLKEKTTFPWVEPE